MKRCSWSRLLIGVNAIFFGLWQLYQAARSPYPASNWQLPFMAVVLGGFSCALAFDPKIVKRDKVEQGDERSLFLRQRARAGTLLAVEVLCGAVFAATLLLQLFTGSECLLPAATVSAGLLLALIAAEAILRAYYSRRP